MYRLLLWENQRSSNSELYLIICLRCLNQFKMVKTPKSYFGSLTHIMTCSFLIILKYITTYLFTTWEKIEFIKIDNFIRTKYGVFSTMELNDGKFNFKLYEIYISVFSFNLYIETQWPNFIIYCTYKLWPINLYNFKYNY